ncbi:MULTISPECIES: response regulator transcription factor [unclassified Variovorax]|uniref:response regulator transcription factor n=1 Tax=unclassified Variovorax TaxID=663243 RepID=UPI003F44F0E7
MHILLVDNDPVLSDFLLTSLSDSGHQVVLATNVEDADCKWRTQGADVVVLDLLLPHTASTTSGFARELAVLRLARDRGDRTPVLVLSARDTPDERIAGLDAGADDYLGKPFDVSEVQARLRALVRRSQGIEDVVTVGQLRLDRKARRFAVAGTPLELPAREFQILWELMSAPGQAVAKRVLSGALSLETESLRDNAIEAFLSRLRKKLCGSGASILTMRGVGYLLQATTAGEDDRHR